MRIAGYRLENGWETLRRANGGQLPRYEPYSLSVEFLVPPSADAFTPTPLLTGRVTNDADAEFWILETMHCGATPAASTNQLLGQAEDCGGDLWYGALVRVQEEEAGRILSNVPVFPATIFGGFGLTTPLRTDRSRQPYALPCPWVLPPGGTIRLDLETRWAGQGGFGFDATTRVWFSFHGFKRYLDEPTPALDWLLEPRLLAMLERLRSQGKRPRIEPYFYGLNLAPSFQESEAALRRASMNTEQVTVSIADADFAGVHLMGQIHDPNNVWRGAQDAFLGTATATPGALNDTVRLTVDQGRIRLDDRPLGFRTLFGNGRRPCKLPVPLYLRKGQSLSAVVQFGETNGVNPEPFRALMTVGGVRVWT